MSSVRITSPDDPALTSLCARSPSMAIELDRSGALAGGAVAAVRRVRACSSGLSIRTGAGRAGTMSKSFAAIWPCSAACLTTTFILTQRTGACRRIAGCGTKRSSSGCCRDLASGDLFAHGRHLASHDQPAAFGQAGADGGSDRRRISAQWHVALGDGRRGGRRDRARRHARRTTAKRPISNCSWLCRRICRA